MQERSILETEFNYYKEHQDEFVAKYDGRVIVLKGQKVVGDYETGGEAYAHACQLYERGTFLIQRVSEGDRHYTTTFRTRAVAPR